MKRCGLKLVTCGSCKHPEFMTIQGGSLCPVQSPALVGLIKHPDEGLILFDTGYEGAFRTATKSLPEALYRWTTPLQLRLGESAAERLVAIGVNPENVKTIILSHFHGDHISGLKTFPRAKIFCAEEGLKQFGRHKRMGRIRRGLLSELLPEDIAARAIFFEHCTSRSLPPDFAPFSDTVDLLGDNSILAVKLPGHCLGHWGLALRLEDERYVFLIGDAAWSIGAVKKNLAPPRLTTFLLGDTTQYRKTLSDLFVLNRANQEMLILPSHCPKAALASGFMEAHDS